MPRCRQAVSPSVLRHRRNTCPRRLDSPLRKPPPPPLPPPREDPERIDGLVSLCQDILIFSRQFSRANFENFFVVAKPRIEAQSREILPRVLRRRSRDFRNELDFKCTNSKVSLSVFLRNNRTQKYRFLETK